MIMALNAGSTAVDPLTGTASGAGLSKSIFDLISPTISVPPGPLGAAGKQKLAELANAIATAVVDHIIANAEVSVDVSGTVAAGIAVSAPPPSGVGSTTSTGTFEGTGTGTIA